MKTYDEVKTIVQVIHECDVELYWYIDQKTGEVKASTNCSDLFYWGCSDGEDVEATDALLLRQTCAELEAYKEQSGMTKAYVIHADSLFAARKRKMRPQGAAYKNIPEELWPLFDACGPYRPIDHGNPFAAGETVEIVRAKATVDLIDTVAATMQPDAPIVVSPEYHRFRDLSAPAGIELNQ